MAAPQPLSELIKSYIDFILSPDRVVESFEVKTQALLYLLDVLALRTHHTSGRPDYEEALESDYRYDELYKTLTLNFSGYGWYSTVLDISPNALENNHCLGDAIDDLADIALDLSNALQVAKAHGEAAGQYDFVASYRMHWGAHLRELQSYLHCRMTEI